ncbi:MAG: riboflavin kinase [Planctomycetota bacterium]|jgi:riboflavin kinase/FMN adenylyltransferase
MTRIAVIGKFDALHVGHRALFATAATMGEPVLLSFTGMAEVLGWDQRAPILAAAQRDQVLAQWAHRFGCHLKQLHLPFADIRPLSAEAFVAYLAHDHGLDGVVVGDDFRFGCDRRGDATVLRHEAAKHGLMVCVVPAVTWNGAAVSTTRVRAALAGGDMVAVQHMLERHHRLYGTVGPGDGRGRGMGFATANVLNLANQAPATGVYAAWAYLRSGAAIPAAVNIGHQPTLGDERPLQVEAHLLDWQGDCYHQPLSLDLVARIRGEQRFADLAALTDQIGADVAAVRRLLADQQSV